MRMFPTLTAPSTTSGPHVETFFQLNSGVPIHVSCSCPAQTSHVTAAGKGPEATA